MNVRKIMFGFLSAALMMGSLAGCGGDKDEGAATSAAPSASAANSKKYTVKMFNVFSFNRAAPILPREEDTPRKMIESAVNVDLEMTVVPEQEMAKLNALVASGDVPDLISFVDRPTAVKFYQQGITVGIDEFLAKAPQLVKRFSNDQWAPMKYQGKTIGIPGYDLVGGINGWWIRNDWLKKLNLKTPTTPDELMEVMKAFTFKDPDGNGKQDTYGFVAGVLKDGKLNDLGFQQIFWMFGVNPNNLDVADGKLIINNVDPRMKEALAYIKKMIDEKVIDPDWSTINEKGQLMDKMYKGKDGILINDWRSLEPSNTEKMKEVSGEIPDWVLIPPMKGPHGDQILSLGTFQQNMWSISKKAAEDPAKAQRIIDMLQYMFIDPQAYKTLSYGIKDLMWKEENSKITIIPTDATTWKNVQWIQHYRFVRKADDPLYYNVQNPKTNEFQQINLKYLKSNNVAPYVVPDPADTISTDREKYVNEMILKFMSGKESLDKWDEYVNTLESKFKLSHYKAIVTKQLQEQGVIK